MELFLDGQLEVDLHFHASGEFNNVGHTDNLWFERNNVWICALSTKTSSTNFGQFATDI